ncbi:MAG TPA: winged helix-turn-helix transcriptional regulator [Candidatus Coprousia avicola]|nr:winged helix-turn-helix transcriptional regulator [Candidatus Coprousia avicola]
MLEERFNEVYSKFKLHFYMETFARFQNREASLTTVESFAMEAIYALGSPTVHEFAQFMRISSSNAAYKVASLIRKGYVEKVRSEHDGREYHLRPTQKYLDYYNISASYVHEVIERIKERFSAEDLAKMEEILKVMSEELMPEVALGGEWRRAALDTAQP